MVSGFNPVCRSQVDLFSKRLLLVPIHLEVHWCLVSADIVKKKICLYDSQGISLLKVARVTTDFLNAFHNDTRSACVSFKMKFCLLCVLLTTEHPEVLDHRSEGKKANGF